MFNEALIFVLIYHLITFSNEYIGSIEGRRVSGISMIVFTLLVLAVNLGLLAYSSLKEKIMNYRMNWYKKRNEKLGKKVLEAKQLKVK